MDFDGLTTEASELTASLANEILQHADYSLADKVRMLVAAFRSIGETYAAKLSSDIRQVLGSENIKTKPEVGSDAQIRELAYKIARDSVFEIDAQELTRDFFTNLFARNAEQGYKNAISLEKHPTITRQLTGADHCEWCAARTGSYSAATFSDLPTEIFRRHLGCKCIIKLSGAGTRSHELNNYIKKGTR